MKNTFIQQLLQQIPGDNDYYSRACVLLPTKRACHHFRDQLVEFNKNSSIWLPTIISIQDFLYENSPLTIAEDEDLLVHLHKVHRSVTGQQQSFPAFYRWGQMILKDFNEIDQYLVEPEYLFNYVRAFKKIEDDPLLSPEQTGLLQQFWGTLPVDADSHVRRNFMETWEALGQIYTRLNSELDQSGSAYQGKAYRALLKDLESHVVRFDHTHFVIAGFNALSTFEERLFQHLVKEYESKLFWDVADHWMLDKQSEPGRFIRRYAALFPEENTHFISTSATSAAGVPKQVEVTEVPMDTLQVDYALELVNQWGTDDTVIVLCDESMIYPLILRMDSALPANITMGFPIGISVLTKFVRDVLELKNYQLIENRLSPSLLLRVVGSEVARRHFPAGKLDQLEERILRWGFINRSDIEELFGKDYPFFKALFSDDDVIDSLADLLKVIHHGNDNTGFTAMIHEGMQQCIGDFKTWLATHELSLSPAEIWSVLKSRIQAYKLPFDHQGAKGLQIMGFLETRNLDFENIIILSADDGNLPGSNRNASFIPFAIKQALSMPTYRENDAIYSYHFYRLLQRASKVALVYAAQLNDKKQDRSRFVEQVLYHWANDPAVEMQEKYIQVPVPGAALTPPVSIDKNNQIVHQVLQQYRTGEKQFSASSLSNYIQCPVQFYLQYVAGISEPETFTEDYDQRDLGRVFHRAMDLFYTPFLSSKEILDKSRLKKYTAAVDLKQMVREAFGKEKYVLPPGDLKGQNLLVHDIIIQLMKMVIEKDGQSEPFRVIGLEERLDKVELNLPDQSRVYFKGYLDRVDEVHSPTEGTFIRIVDYKTGTAGIATMGKKSMEEYFKAYFEDPRKKEGFQGYLYAWMYRQIHEGPALKAGLYSAKAMSKGLQYLAGGKTISLEQLAVFEHYLSNLVNQILDESEPFLQSESADAYKYSGYSVLVD